MAVKDGWRLGEVTLPNAHRLEVAEVVMTQIRCVPTIAQAMAQTAVSRQVSSGALELQNFAKVLWRNGSHGCFMQILRLFFIHEYLENMNWGVLMFMVAMLLLQPVSTWLYFYDPLYHCIS